MHLSRLVALILLALCTNPCLAQVGGPGQLGINVYGVSYHFDGGAAKELGFDKVNPGAGLRYRLPRQGFDWFLDSGIYHDSGGNTAVFAGGGAFWKPAARLRLGSALVLFHSDTYNRGEPFIAPLPLLALEWRKVSLNFVYFPKVSGINEINTLGFWLTFWPKAF